MNVKRSIEVRNYQSAFTQRIARKVHNFVRAYLPPALRILRTSISLAAWDQFRYPEIRQNTRSSQKRHRMLGIVNSLTKVAKGACFDRSWSSSRYVATLLTTTLRRRRRRIRRSRRGEGHIIIQAHFGACAICEDMSSSWYSSRSGITGISWKRNRERSETSVSN